MTKDICHPERSELSGVDVPPVPSPILSGTVADRKGSHGGLAAKNSSWRSLQGVGRGRGGYWRAASTRAGEGQTIHPGFTSIIFCDAFLRLRRVLSSIRSRCRLSST